MIQGTFSKLARLRKQFDFKNVFRRHKRLHSEHFQVCYHFADQEQARLGVVVSKRNVKRAVTRNLIRRIVKEHFRHYQQKLRRLDIIVIAKKPAESAPREALHACIDTLFNSLVERQVKR